MAYWSWPLSSPAVPLLFLTQRNGPSGIKHFSLIHNTQPHGIFNPSEFFFPADSFSLFILTCIKRKIKKFQFYWNLILAEDRGWTVIYVLTVAGVLSKEINCQFPFIKLTKSNPGSIIYRENHKWCQSIITHIDNNSRRQLR